MFGSGRKYRQKLGRRGENIACDTLQSCGMKILARNWRCKAGELDIVALDGDTIVFAEVKTTRYRRDFTPAENLSFRQRRRNYNAAKVYLRSLDIIGYPGRFDLIEVSLWWRIPVQVVHHRDYLPQLPARGSGNVF
ncbi:MAG: YraN family protein [Lentisphaerae bacterium]|nr:YraN family protein [Lentisphaerota bacterium]MBQ9804589.1 YraN family protein [Lentisphaeria bacterium]